MLKLKVAPNQTKPFWNIVDNLGNIILEGIRGRRKAKHLMKQAKICPNCCNYSFEEWDCPFCSECGEEIPPSV